MALSNSDSSSQVKPAACNRPYSFPASKLAFEHRNAQHSPGARNISDRVPLIFVACGSFSPITYLHLRLFEVAKDWARLHSNYEPVGGYLSPVGDAYIKAGLASAAHRITMCTLAVDQEDRVSGSSGVMVDDWEALHDDYMPTAEVLDHFQYEINEKMGGVKMPNGERKQAKIVLLAGADLLSTMSTPGLWPDEDLDRILCGYGAFIVERDGTDINAALSDLQKKEWQDAITIVEQQVQNDVSSTKIRQFLKQDKSIRYLVPGPVIEYIEKHNLYIEDRPQEGTSTLKSITSATSSSPDRPLANEEAVAS